MEKVANIICLGSWNTRIFTPEWVSTHVFKIQLGESIQIQIDTKTLSLTYRKDDIIFIANDTSIEFKSDKFDHYVLNSMMGYFKNLLKLLPNTPITIYGYNIKLSIPDKSPDSDNDLIRYFNQTTLNGFCTAKLNLTKSVGKCLHGIIIEKQSDNYIITFNHQYQYLDTDDSEATVYKNIEDEIITIIK